MIRAHRLQSQAATYGERIRASQPNPTSDSAARLALAAECGMLRGHVADLCAELQPTGEGQMAKLRRLLREAREAAEVVFHDPEHEDGADAVIDQLTGAQAMVDQIKFINFDDEPDYDAPDYMALAKQRAEDERFHLRSGLNF